MNTGFLQRGAVALLLALTFSACSPTSEPDPEQTVAEEAAAPVTPEALGTVSSVADLQTAFVAAGGTCEGDLEDINNVGNALGSGVCPDSGTVLTIYVDHDSAKDAVSTLMKLVDRLGSTMILGENWAINPSGADKENAQDIADQLGGQLLQTEATPVRSLDDAFTLEQAAEAYAQADGTSCEDPVDIGDTVPILECSDLTLIAEADTVSETGAQRQQMADSLDLDGAIPVVGRRHIVAIYSSDIDPDSVAAQIDGTTPSA